MPATLFHKITESFAGTLFVGHSDGELMFLEQVALRPTTSAPLIDAIVRALSDMRQLSDKTVAAPSHVVRFMGQLGIVAPYFEAVPLRLLQVTARERKTSFPVAVAIKIALDVFDGLCLYHALDAKLCGGICPDQLLVGTDGDTRVGNVPVPAISPKESPWRGKVERLAYLAPEQLTAAKSFDARTDVYTMGVILWEMIANQSRLVGSPGQILESLRNANGLPILTPLDDSKVSKRLLDALGRALHANPLERQPSIGAFARDLLEADETPADSKDVGAFVEQVANHSLQLLRTAIALQQIQTIRQSRASRVAVPSTSQAATKASGEKKPVTSTAATEANLPPNSDHTAVFKVTAELLEKARRGPAPSDSKQRVGAPAAVELPVESDQTVTFEVPEILLEEARRLFEASEQSESDTEPESSVSPSSVQSKGASLVATPGKATSPSLSNSTTPASAAPKDSTAETIALIGSTPVAAKGPTFALKKGPMSVPRPSKSSVSAPTPSRGPLSVPAHGPKSVPASPMFTAETAAASTSPPAAPQAQDKTVERTLESNACRRTIEEIARRRSLVSAPHQASRTETR